MNETEYDPIADYQNQLMKMMDPSYLHTVSMDELYETVYQSKQVSILSSPSSQPLRIVKNERNIYG